MVRVARRAALYIAAAQQAYSSAGGRPPTLTRTGNPTGSVEFLVTRQLRTACPGPNDPWLPPRCVKSLKSISDGAPGLNRAAMTSSIYLRPPKLADQRQFLKLVRRSRRLHRPWIIAPSTPKQFRAFIERIGKPENAGFLICETESDDVVGVINISNVVLGSLRSLWPMARSRTLGNPSFIAEPVDVPTSSPGHADLSKSAFLGFEGPLPRQ